MKKQSIYLFTLTLIFCMTLSSCADSPNKLTGQQKKDGWTLLFNGKDFNGWRQYNGNEMPANWTIEDNSMKVFLGEGRKDGQGAGGDIIYELKEFRDFELSIDWKTAPEGNSGIFYYVKESPGSAIYSASPEIQILDNENASDNKIDSHLAGSLYDMLPAIPQNARPAGEWNTILVRVKDGRVTHIQNGEKVVEYELWTPEWDEMVENSKFRDFPGFTAGIPHEGYIGLQDHGYTIWFRNIMIREL